MTAEDRPDLDAPWLVEIVLPRPFGGLATVWRQDGERIMIPFSTRDSADSAAAQIRVKVVPGARRVIAGTVEHD